MQVKTYTVQIRYWENTGQDSLSATISGGGGNDGLHGTNTENGSVTLGPGDHDIVVIFFENTGGDNLSATISCPDTGSTAIDLGAADIAAPSATSVAQVPGDDTIDGGLGDDTIDAGDGDDTQTGGLGNDSFVEDSGDGADIITELNAGNTGSLTDGDQSNNDFVDLSDFYNATTLTDVNAAGGSFATQLGILRADAADGHIDGIVGGVDYSAEIGDVDLTLQNGGTAVTESDLTFDNTNVVCFAKGSRVLTSTGPQPVETLKVGQLVQTADGSARGAQDAAKHVARPTLLACPCLAKRGPPKPARSDPFAGFRAKSACCAAPQKRSAFVAGLGLAAFQNWIPD